MKILAAALLALTLAACGKPCSGGITVAYQDPADGIVKFRPLAGTCPVGPGFNTGGVFADGHMPAPEPGRGWNH